MKNRTTPVDPTRWGISRGGRFLATCLPVLVPFLVVGLLVPAARAQESIEHDTSRGEHNSLVKVDADTYALAYTGRDTDGYIKTFTISASGATITEVASLEHDTDNAFGNSLVQVDADTYALAYAGSAFDGYIKTFTISADGTTITEVASLEHETGQAVSNSLVRVDADTYALAYAGTLAHGFIKTFTIPADGTTITEVASLEHAQTQGEHNSLVKVDADTYALAFTGKNSDGFIRTFTISADGTTITQVANFEHDPVQAAYNSLVQVDADTYALAYRSGVSDGYIKTFTISADGTTITEVASLEHETLIAWYNSLVQVSADVYALAYAGADSDGFIATFTISADGTTITEVASLEHNLDRGTFNSLIRVDADTCALAYSGADFHGFITTFPLSARGDLTMISRYTIDGGGVTSSAGAVAATGSIGQPDAGVLSNGSVVLSGGFWTRSIPFVPVELQSFEIVDAAPVCKSPRPPSSHRTQPTEEPTHDPQPSLARD